MIADTARKLGYAEHVTAGFGWAGKADVWSREGLDVYFENE